MTSIPLPARAGSSCRVRARRTRLGEAPIDLEFTLEGEGGGVYTVQIRDGVLHGKLLLAVKLHLILG